MWTARRGEAIRPDTTLDTLSKTIYIKWRAHGANEYMAVFPLLGIEEIPFADDDCHKFYLVSHGGYTTDHSFNGSTLIQDDQWCYTRGVVHSDRVEATTAFGNYDDNGGTVIDSIVRPLYSANYSMWFWLMFYDAYGATDTYVALGEFRIEDSGL